MRPKTGGTLPRRQGSQNTCPSNKNAQKITASLAERSLCKHTFSPFPDNCRKVGHFSNNCLQTEKRPVIHLNLVEAPVSEQSLVVTSFSTGSEPCTVQTWTWPSTTSSPLTRKRSSFERNAGGDCPSSVKTQTVPATDGTDVYAY